MILLSCDESDNATKYTDKEISVITGVSLKTIDSEKKKFVEGSFEAVMSPGKSKRVYINKLDGELEAYLVALCCSQYLDSYIKWSLRLLADKMVERQYV